MMPLKWFTPLLISVYIDVLILLAVFPYYLSLSVKAIKVQRIINDLQWTSKYSLSFLSQLKKKNSSSLSTRNP